MKEQKLANLEQLKERYKERVRKYFLGEFLVQFAVGLAFHSTVCYFVLSVNSTIQIYQWLLPATIITAFLMIPLVKINLPRKPTALNVEKNKALRRALNMDDSESEG